MEIKFQKDKKFITNLILQRTGSYISLGGAPQISKWTSTGETDHLLDYLQKNNLVEKYLQSTFNEIQTDINQLLEKIGDTKDLLSGATFSIGPGNCLFELLLYKKLKAFSSSDNPSGTIYLVDIEQTPELHQHMFYEKGSGYADLGQSRDFLINNDFTIPVNICNPKKNKLPDVKFNFLYSVLSMGFHYPIADYLDFILKNSADQALLIFDDRRGQNIECVNKVLEKYTKVGEINQKKHDRVVFKKNR